MNIFKVEVTILDTEEDMSRQRTPSFDITRLSENEPTREDDVVVIEKDSNSSYSINSGVVSRPRTPPSPQPSSRCWQLPCCRNRKKRQSQSHSARRKKNVTDLFECIDQYEKEVKICKVIRQFHACIAT